LRPVPPEVEKLAPDGTVWFGGPVDRTLVTLRVRAAGDERLLVEALLGVGLEPHRSHCSIAAPKGMSGDLEQQIQFILDSATPDLAKWQEVASRWPMDVFCGLFLERPNRGLSISAPLLKQLGDRGVTLGLDIYSHAPSVA
jgi:hypothetical protein